MIDLPFDVVEIPSSQVREIAEALKDEAVAKAVVEDGMRAFERGTGSWVPRLILLATHRLKRHKDFFKFYQGFLEWTDAQPKKDWHSSFLDRAPANNLFFQSGVTGLPPQKFEAEFKRLLKNIGPPGDGPILDVGCGGGLWSLKLAQHGYKVVGIDRHPGIIEAARQNAKTLGVEWNVEFFVDDACDSRLPATYNTPRVLCIGLTACLPDDAAFESLISFLDRVSRVPNSPPYGRMVVLGANRWRPTRMEAVKGILKTDPGNYSLAAYHLFLIELNWWMALPHLESIKKRFPKITLIGERTDKIDGTREDFLLQ